MFAIEELRENGFDKIVMTDGKGECRVEVVPECGAMLHGYSVLSKNEWLNIIDSYLTKDDFDKNAEALGFKGLKLSPFACRIKNAAYHFLGREYHFQKIFQDGSAIHGLLYRGAFKVTSKYHTENESGVKMIQKYSGDDRGYPFPYNCIVEYKLEKGNSLKISTTVQNCTNITIPIADGWHPYFRFNRKIDNLFLSFDSSEMLEFVDLIPTGKLIPTEKFTKPRLIGNSVFDNCFYLDFANGLPMISLADTNSGFQLNIIPDHRYRYLQVYTPPHRNSIALENISGAPDCFNNKMGLEMLEPGQELTFSTQYKISSLNN
ncbi:MAG: aldose 1-epimerase [Bacteroidetes bacterium]|nr:MAG: aldose 1-epimerase [Bacteroidota bacterium]